MPQKQPRVSFYDKIDDTLYQFAVIVAVHNGKLVFCRHKERSTYEIPGGHREPGEAILDAARRELFEETGALDYDLTPVCAYGVKRDGKETFGMLYYAHIRQLGPLPDSEIAQVLLFREIPFSLTYPDIQPALTKKALEGIFL